jgi:hypothetical protein
MRSAIDCNDKTRSHSYYHSRMEMEMGRDGKRGRGSCGTGIEMGREEGGYDSGKDGIKSADADARFWPPFPFQFPSN